MLAIEFEQTLGIGLLWRRALRAAVYRADTTLDAGHLAQVPKRHIGIPHRIITAA